MYSFIDFRQLVLEVQCPQNFRDIQTDRHFLNMVNSCSEHRNPSKTACQKFLRIQEESTGVAKIFDCWFSMDLHVLRGPEYDLTIFKKCLSVCTPPKFCGHCTSKSNGRKLLKLYIQLHFSVIRN